MSKDYYNQSHCPDPTAYEVLNRIEAQKDEADASAELEIKKLLRLIRFITRVYGFEIEGRITFIHTETGHIYM